MDKLKYLIENLISEKNIIRLIFSNIRNKNLPFNRVILRPVFIQEKLLYQAEFHQEKKVTHENLESNTVLGFCNDLILTSFKQLNIFSANADYQILASKPQNIKIIKNPPSRVLPKEDELAHNRKKRYILPEDEPCDFLIKLGIMNNAGQVHKNHYGKFRQINKFLEIVKDGIKDISIHTANSSNNTNSSAPNQRTSPIRIIDFGCGKAYLTFALYYYLKILEGVEVEITGLDLKSDVIDFCNKIAHELNYTGLSFLIGDIADYSEENADIVVTLHACDTATDYALINAVKWNTSLILSVPCCQHELFSQIENNLHNSMMKHGIIKDKFTELLTDSLRALKLEASGYDVDMVEFTSLEHTSKNILIRATKSTKLPNPKTSKAIAEYNALKDFWKVNPTIDLL